MTTIRDYQAADAAQLALVYYHAIHNIDAQYYNKTQLAAWAPKSALKAESWQSRWEKCVPLVAVSDKQIVGFVEFELNGHIDCFYCHPNFQGKGVGSCLLAEVEKKALRQRNERIYAEVSLNAKTFFEYRGFQVIKGQTVERQGVKLQNFLMEKEIRSV